MSINNFNKVHIDSPLFFSNNKKPRTFLRNVR